MNPTAFLMVVLHLVMLPIVFNILKLTKLETLFRKNSPPSMIVLLYFLLTFAITQLVLSYFFNFFGFVFSILS